MMMRDFLRRWEWIVLLVLLLAGCEGGIYSGTLVFEGEHEFGAETRLPGDVAVRAGTAEFLAGSQVDGAIYVLGGTLRFNGQTGGDVVILDGDVSLGPESVVGGDLRVGGGSLTRAETAVVRGETITGAVALPVPTAEPERDAAGVVRSLISALLLAGVGGVWAWRRPEMPERILRAAGGSWPAALALGLLALLVLPVLLVMMAFTIVLIPLVFVLGVLILLTLGMGVVALGKGVVEGVAQWLGRPVGSGAAAFVGVLVLLLLFQVPLVGEVLLIGTSLLLFGGVLLTRFGTRGYRPPAVVTEVEELSSYARPERSEGPERSEL